MPIMTGRKAMLEMLRIEGIDYIFGNPGTSESPIMHELESFPDLKYILVLQEGVAMGMADAYARATKKPSFVNLHIETGLANGISLLHNAFAGGTPIVLSAGNKDIREIVHGRTDLAGMVRPFTKWSTEITHSQQIPFAMRRAFNGAKTPPTGPTFVGFSANALDDTADVDIIGSPKGYFKTKPDAKAIENAADLLATSINPAIVLGDRVADSGASSEATRIADLLGAPVYATTYSEMSFPTSNHHFFGTLKLGYPDSNLLLSRADVVLAVGELSTGNYMFSNPVLRFFAPSVKLIHIDSDASGIGGTQPTEVGIVADPKISLDQLAGAIETTMSGTARELAKYRSTTLSSIRNKADNERDIRIKKGWNTFPMSPSRMMKEVASALPTDTIIVDDAVTTRDALLDSIHFDKPGSLYGGRGGALGWGIGGGMGVKLANPDKPVVSVIGDGSAMMTIQGLWTTSNENLPVIYLICNNSSYKILKLNMDKYRSLALQENGDRNYLGMDFPLRLDIAGMARSMGVSASTIEDPAEISPAIGAALDSGKPALLDITIDGTV